MRYINLHPHLRLEGSPVACEIRHFSDGEIIIELQENVQSMVIWIIASTEPPAENFFTLFLLLNALERAGACIHLVITYLGYTRQDKPSENEPASLEMISTLLRQFLLQKMYILHPHSKIAIDLLQAVEIIPYSLFEPIARDYDVIVVPDKGASVWAYELARRAEKHTLCFEKKRVGRDEVALVGPEKSKLIEAVSYLIVDDLISTGSTIIKEADFLVSRGARRVSALATHALWHEEALVKIEKSCLDVVYVTNSTSRVRVHPKISLLNLSSIINDIMLSRTSYDIV